MLRVQQYDSDGNRTAKSTDLRNNDMGVDNFGFTGAANGAYVNTKDGSEVGIRPVPGIKQITCEYLSNEGYASRIATVNWSAPTLEALETFEVFLTTGYEVALQWGWSSPQTYQLDAGQSFITVEDERIKIDQSLFSSPRRKILAANGNLDAIGGTVSNFTSKLRDDGGFDCTTEIDAMGVNFYSFSGHEDAVGGLGQVLPQAVQQTIEDAKEGLIADLEGVTIGNIKETTTKAKEGFFAGLLGSREKTEEEKQVLQLALQDHMLNALINLEGIANYYGVSANKETNITVEGPDNLRELLLAGTFQTDKQVLENVAKIDAETQAANVFSGNPLGKDPISGVTSVVNEDFDGDGERTVTVYPVGVNNGTGGWPCWVAAELYGGWYEPRTILARRYVSSDKFPKFLYDFYVKYGERIAGFIRKYKFVKPLFRPIFDIFVKRGRYVND